MASFDFNSTTTTTKKADYRVPPVTPDSPANVDENFWDNPRFTDWLGIYINIKKVNKALQGYADWILGQGYTSSRVEELEHISGNGKEDFNSVLWNAIILKKVNGESYTHVMRDPDNKETGEIINMRVLDPNRMRVVYNGKGRIVEFRYYNTTTRSSEYVTYKPREILMLQNDKIGDEMHGRSVIEGLEWNVQAQEKAKKVLDKLTWRAGVVRVIEVDTSNATELAQLKAQYKIAEENGDVLLLPKDKARAVDWKPNLDYAGIIAWLDYLENDFWMSIGFPRDLSGASTSATEAGMKMSYINHMPLYEKEVREVEDALWNQIGLRLEFVRQRDLMGNAQSDEAKNTGQTQLQPIGTGQ